MKNQVVKIENTLWKSVMIAEDSVYLSSSKEKSAEAFEKSIEKSGMLSKTEAIPFASISGVNFNESSDTASISYTNAKGKAKDLKLQIGDDEISNQFGEFLGQELGLARTETQEGTLKPLLLNALYLVIAIGATIFLGTMDGSEEIDTDSGSRKSQRNKAIFKFLYETLGPTGIIIVGSLISLYLGYRLYNRYKNPAKEVAFTR